MGGKSIELCIDPLLKLPIIDATLILVSTDMVVRDVPVNGTNDSNTPPLLCVNHHNAISR